MTTTPTTEADKAAWLFRFYFDPATVAAFNNLTPEQWERIGPRLDELTATEFPARTALEQAFDADGNTVDPAALDRLRALAATQ